MNGEQAATTQQQQFQEMMAAQMSAMQQQLAMQQGATAAAMQQSAAAMAANQRASTPTASNRTNNHSGNWQQQAWTNMQQAPYCPPAGNTMPNSSGKAPTPYRWYENQNYCHTHGHHIENDHTSQTCKRPGPNHNPNTTKFNSMGGSNAGAHKTTMPSQCGRTPNTKTQSESDPRHSQWRAAGFPPTPRPFNRRNGGGRQQQGQMMMPSMYGQPAMMNMAGVILKQPMANFGYGNINVGFQGANMENNMGYGQGYGNMNNY